MAKLDFSGIGKNLKSVVGSAVDSVGSVVGGAADTIRTAAQDIKLPTLGKERAEVEAPAQKLPVRRLSTDSAIRIIYYLMAADGAIYHNEEEKFDAICTELAPSFAEHREELLAQCRTQMDKALEPEDYYDTLQDGVEEALTASHPSEDSFITPKLLVWDLLTIAYSDGSYDETERRLIKYLVRKLDIDKAVFLELESSLETLMELEAELAWLKTTNRPYLTIESMVNEIADRKAVIFESVKDLITL